MWVQNSRENEQSVDAWLDMMQNYYDLQELDRSTLMRIIQKIELVMLYAKWTNEWYAKDTSKKIHAVMKSKGCREQRIVISYGLVGILPVSLLNSLQNGGTA